MQDMRRSMRACSDACLVCCVCMLSGLLRLGVFGLLLHDVQDHAARGGAALRGGVDADGLLRRPCVLLAVHVDPAGTHKEPSRSLDGRVRLFFYSFD